MSLRLAVIFRFLLDRPLRFFVYLIRPKGIFFFPFYRSVGRNTGPAC